MSDFKRGGRQLCKPKDLENKTPMGILQGAGEKMQLPVDLDAVLKSLKIIAAPVDFTSLEEAKGDALNRLGRFMGLVGIRNENVVMGYSKNLDFSHQRYAVAHELGHACIHTDVLMEGHILARYTGTLENDKERAADKFAAELLLPEEGFNALFDECLILFGLEEDDVDLQEHKRRIATYISDKGLVPYFVAEDRLLELKPHVFACECEGDATGD